MAEMRVHIDEEATRTSYLLHGISWEKNEHDLIESFREENNEGKSSTSTFMPCKLGSKFSGKDKTELIHQHNLTYHFSCANKRYEASYAGETKRRMLTRIIGHNKIRSPTP